MSKLLVIGGGIGGLAAIVSLRKLDKEVEIVLVEPKDYIEIAWCAFRSPFEEWVREGSVMALEGFCEKNNVKHVQDVVTKLDLEAATLKGGDVVGFSLCVVATGAATKWAEMGRGIPMEGATTREGRIEAMKATGTKLIDAESVLVVGGGLIGCELAGDIAYYSTEAGKPTKVTVVHSGAHLVPEYSESAATMLQKKLEKIGVTIILNDKATKSADGKTMTLASSGKEIEAQEVVMTVGLDPINGFLKEGGLASSLNEKGFIKTDKFLRIEGTDGKLFGLGDCCTHLPNAGTQILGVIPAVGSNLKVALDAIAEKCLLEEDKLKEIKVQPEAYLCSAGPKQGVFVMKDMFHTQYMLPWVKNSTMFLFKVKGDLGF